MTRTEVFAPAKINLTLHVTGQRADGYHLLDSLVVFADVGDTVAVQLAPDLSLDVTGPMMDGVPTGGSNLVHKAASAFETPVAITLGKHLPAAAGIGGGSSDAAATLKAMSTLTSRPVPVDPLTFGADVPVCMIASAARMQGIGEQVTPLTLPLLHAVLVNPRVGVSTPAVFKSMSRRDNPAMSAIPEGVDADGLIQWLAEQRNDLETPAIALEPVIGDVLNALKGLEGVRLTRMSGSGATCFALFDSRAMAEAQAKTLRARQPGWWVAACSLR
ncbi:4-(cytidine 5'-diphospho)-2-C-methyl-D-erythritol kinase [Pacificoceanicola onchidii]|uniref:4-(cytidine 5'-diphospho)-2-C-methyl-D-erythritol kinase n=1 Tax=Pacificoceanicola onchidii TaxID=2562685 RepID=UPI0010A464AD|nr:4-(cytidine 5'-diphospho)-2-C-methyl-D-erythritol kinase [Pacificoceanicola onchidii]